MHKITQFLGWLAVFAFVALRASAAPSTRLWYGDRQNLHAVEPSTDSVALSVGFEVPIALAVDAGDGSVWALAQTRLVRFDAHGATQTTISLPDLGGGLPRLLALDPSGTALWVGFESRVVRFGAGGAQLNAIELRAEDFAVAADGSLWLLGANSLRHYGAAGNLLKSVPLTGELKQARHLALDEADGTLWAASPSRLFKLSLAAPLPALFSVAAQETVALAKDARDGERWLLGQYRLFLYGRDGKVRVSRALGNLSAESPRALVFDAANQAVWVGHQRGLSRARLDATLAARFPAPTPVNAVAIGSAPVGGGEDAEPVLTMVEPADGALLTVNRPTFVVKYGARCGGVPCTPPGGFFEALALSARLNGAEVGPSFVFNPATASASFTPAAPLPEGVNTFTARAQDAAGHPSNELALAFTVDTIAPAFQNVTPADGGVFEAPPIVIQGHVDDPSATVTLDGQAQGAEFFFPVTLAPGVNAFTLEARDAAGNATALTLSYTFEAPNLAPQIAIVQPSAGAHFEAPASFTVAASAFDPDGSIALVEFFVGGTPFGADLAPPYSAALSNLPPGAYVLTARATDDRGGSTTSEAVTVTVGPPNALPTVKLTSPANGTQFSAPAAVAVAAEAADADGTIARVEFFRNGALAATLTAPPYATTLADVPAGTHVITARATDDRGGVKTSAPVTVTAAATALTITSPALNATIDGETVLVRGNAAGLPNSGVVVNGEVAARDAAGNFSALVALTPGTNEITATLTTPDGTILTRSVTVFATGTVSPFYATASPARGFAPLQVTFNVVNPTPQDATFTFDGFGPFDLPAGAEAQLGLAYPIGVFAPALVFTDLDGRTYTQRVIVESLNQAALDQTLRAVWGGMNQALAAGDKAGALRYLNGGAKLKFGPVFDALMPFMGEIVASYSPLAQSSLSGDLGEYAVTRLQNGQKRLYLISFLRDVDGVWRVDEM